ncbi:signal transduction histidine kinase [Neobacillus niacini]|uniref:histidine kinase dimerization/phospho-acceptor domain-containing protein n=1 Tax=Neobacillus driksii TaxID=3035913 RepID=UPI0027816117|nr:histidine kinase dimerization/phospho-acceptor domain-containing protein [Neobacillus niacini]MDQ0974809.1 signal transduction histidine kinase [Neobacillus niacini]
MDIKLKKYSHLLTTKIVVFIVMILCFTGIIKAFVDVEIVNDGDFGIVFEEDYFHSSEYVRESDAIIGQLTRLLTEYKSEEHIVNGGSISEDEVRSEEETLYSDFQVNSKNFNPNLSEKENYDKFKTEYADKISLARDRLIKNDLREFHSIVQNLEEIEDPLYYGSDGVNVYTNRTQIEKEQYKTYPSYLVFDGYKREIYPKEIEENEHFYQINERIEELDPESQVVYVAFTKEFLTSKMNEWKNQKEVIKTSFYQFLAFLSGFILTFLYLVLVIGRKSFTDKEVKLNPIDKLYIDVKLVLLMCLMALWAGLVDSVNIENMDALVFPITIPIAAAGFALVLSVVRHIKNKTFFTHTLIYRLIHLIVTFVRNVYDSGSVGVKTVLLVIGYPLLVAATFFIFPVTLGIAAWFAYKRVKSFTAIQEGVARIKDGDIQHSIDVGGKGEFAKLASNINSITDGLKKAVNSELKSERLKTELITNVSHDIRTPLTSIITYVDLLKKEKDPSKVEQYIEVLDQKSKRLKVLTDDLFDAAKASSGNIPVQFERIDIISLITQGLGEVNDKIEHLDLAFKFSHPKDKVYVQADGKLLWRSIENVLSNIFKYTLKGSRVYIDIEVLENEILLTFKNISAYELNISADELMERFKRGDESRSSNGSGLGLSIAKSLIEIQKGEFSIQVDGDLFKSMIYLPKYKNSLE